MQLIQGLEGEPPLPTSMDAIVIALGLCVHVWSSIEGTAKLRLVKKINDVDGLPVQHLLLSGIHFDKLIPAE